MAKYKSILQLQGAIGDVVYYTLNGKQIVRRKAKDIGERIKTCENYAVTRKNNSEFTTANHIASGLYRMAKLIGYRLDPAQQRKMVSIVKLFIQRNKEINHFKPEHYARMFSGVKLHKNFKPALVAVNRYTHGTFIRRFTKDKFRLTIVFGQYLPVMKYENQYSTQLDMEKVATVEYDFDTTDNADELINFDALLPELDFEWDVCVLATVPFDSEGRVWEEKASVWVM
jgi:hypothetical protein